MNLKQKLAEKKKEEHLKKKKELKEKMARIAREN
jgi:hypothetical protein